MGRDAIDSIDLELGSLATFLERVAETPRATPEALLEIAEADPDLEIVETLGSGGMGVVFLARDKRLDRQVAVKIHRQADRPEAADLVLWEARAMARLAHPNIVSVYEVREIGDHVVVIMEYVKGQTLEEWLAAKDRELDEIVRVFSEAGTGLCAAHDANLVHRDFKPANVIVGDDGRVRVADFGIAVIGEAQGSVAGTPAYMAPEQLEQGVVDARADQFAFCTALGEATERIQGNSRLCALVKRGQMAKPEARFSSMVEALEELARVRTTSATRRPLWGKLLVGTAGLVAIGASVRFFAAADSPNCAVEATAMSERWNLSAREQLLTSFAASKREFASDYATQLVSNIDDLEKRWRRARKRSCEEGTVRRSLCLDGHLARADALFRFLTEARPTVVDHALDLFDLLPSPSCELEPKWPATLDLSAYVNAVSALETARLHRIVGEKDIAIATIVDLHSIISSAHEPTLSAAWAAQSELAGLGRSTLEKDDFVRLEAETAVELKLLRAAESDVHVLRSWVEALESGRPPPSLLESAWLSLAARSTTDEKIRLHRRVLESRRTRLGASNPLLYPVLKLLGTELVSAEQFVEARPPIVEALVFLERYELPKSELRAVLVALGAIEQALSNSESAIGQYKRLLAMTERSDSRYASYLGALCIALVQDGAFDDALTHCNRGIAMFDAQARRDLLYAHVHDNLGRVMMKTSRYKEGLLHFKIAASVSEQNSDPYDHVEFQYGVIQSLRGLGRNREALLLLERMVQLGDEKQQKDLQRLRQQWSSFSR